MPFVSIWFVLNAPNASLALLAAGDTVSGLNRIDGEFVPLS